MNVERKRKSVYIKSSDDVLMAVSSGDIFHFILSLTPLNNELSLQIRKLIKHKNKNCHKNMI